MAPNLPQVAASRSRLHPEKLWDPSLLPPPERVVRGSPAVAWMLDWSIALMLASGMVNTWVLFLDPLVLEQIPAESQEVFLASARALLLLLAPLLRFGLVFLGVHQGGQTLGQRLLHHHVARPDALPSALEAFRWAAASTLLPHGWGGLRLESRHFALWEAEQDRDTHTRIPDLVAQATENPPLELPRAA